MTGHSLGGGLAALAALETNRPAVTFNAAGVNGFTQVLELTLNGWYSNRTVNYSVEGDHVTDFQYNFWFEAFGELKEIPPAEQDANDSKVQLHSMKDVLDALGEEDVPPVVEG